MSGTSTPRSAGGQPKQMSSRLLTMKFMQRAAASSPTQSPQTFTPSSQGPPSAKRPRLDDSAPSTPFTPSDQADSPKEFADRSAVSAALRAEADARTASRAKMLREGGETEWVLNMKLPVTNGHQATTVADEVDEDESSPWTSRNTGRQTYGAFKRRKVNASAANGMIPTTSQVPNDANLSPAPTSDSDASASESDEEEGEIPSSPAIHSHSYTKRPKNQYHASATSSTNTSTTTSPHPIPAQTTTTSSRKKRKPSISLSEDHDGEARRMDSLNLSRMSSLSGNHGARSGSRGSHAGGNRGGASGSGGGAQRRKSGGGAGDKYKQAFMTRKDRKKMRKTQ